ncbi:MAG: hypothetical protein M3310_01975 [Actinomycetota bacterium]|nr:hypothetical protein [Actinomycetota bacterium]
MARWLLIVLLGLTLLAGAGCGSDEEDEATPENQIEVSLSQQSGSAQSGKATLSEVDETTTRVEIDMTPGDQRQPAHIHRGDCVNLEKQPEYPLESVADGRSTTEVNASLDELLGGGFAINVHKSDAEIETYVACGEISSGPGAAEPEPGETETTDTTETETGETETGETETGETETEDSGSDTDTDTGADDDGRGYGS